MKFESSRPVAVWKTKAKTVRCGGFKRVSRARVQRSKKCYSSLTCCRLGVDEIVAAKWRGVSFGDSNEDDDEQFDWELLSYC